MEVGKTADWHRNVRSLEVDMSMYLTSLAGETRAGPGSRVAAHVRPAETVAYQATGGTYSRVVDLVKVLKNLFAESNRHERTENPGGNVPKDGYLFNQPGNDAEGRGRAHDGDVRAGTLRRCHF